jgi:hypothetical protein
MHGVFGGSGAAARVTIACALLVSAAGGVGAARAQSAAGCGSATASTLATVDAMVAGNIYRNELNGTETQTDLGHVKYDPVLLAALADGDRAGAAQAVARLVYHHFWHIVRLRVLDASGRLVADVGGPHVIAPVSGLLRSAAGAPLGSFVMSVQDDVGFTKLEVRAVGDPIGVYSGGRLVAELGAAFPNSEPTGASLTLGGVSYLPDSLPYGAFPAGTLDAVLAVPVPPAALTRQSCLAVSVGEVGRVAERLALRFHPLATNYPNFVEVVHSETGAVVVVRIGLREVAGSEGLGPATLPLSGTVSYERRNWSVFSFAPTPPARVYLLIPSGS